MSVTISKEFSWEMGHRLPYHTAGCENIHGHSYRARIELLGDPDENGMVLDYGVLSKIVRPIIDQLDHAFMVDQSDTMMKQVLAASGLKQIEVPFYSTAENIAAWFLDQVRERLGQPKSVRAVTVTVMETSRTSATCSWCCDV